MGRWDRVGWGGRVRWDSGEVGGEMGCGGEDCIVKEDKRRRRMIWVGLEMVDGRT